MANPNKAAVGFGYDLKQRIEEKVKSYPKGKTYTDLRDLIAADIESITGESIDKNMLHGRIKNCLCQPVKPKAPYHTG